MSSNSFDNVSEIKRRLSIVDIVSEYVQLKQAGNSMKGLSPFKSEKTPSFFVSPDKEVFYCFATQKGGDMFTFIQEVEGIEFKDALKLLADKAGVELQHNVGTGEKKKEIDRLLSILKEAQEFFVSNTNQKTNDYLVKRGLSEQATKEFGIGISKNEWDALAKHLTTKGFDKKDIENTGLVISKDNKIFDRFKRRLMFPIHNQKGELVGYSGRQFENEDDGYGKYVNTPETMLYNKSELLYGLDKAKEYIRKFDYSIVVEGYFDVILSHQSGFKNTVAVCGTALTDGQIKLLKRYSDNVIMSFDGDDAGVKAILRNAKELLKFGMSVKVVDIHDTEDPADIILRDKNQWKEKIKDSLPIFKFICKIANSKEGTSKSKFISDEIIPFLVSINDDIVQELSIKEVAEELDMSKEAISKKIQETAQDSEIPTETIIETNKLNNEHSILDLIAYSIENDIKLKLMDDGELTEVFLKLINFPEGYDKKVGILRYENEKNTNTLKDMAIIELKDKGVEFVLDKLKNKRREIASEVSENKTRVKEVELKDVESAINKITGCKFDGYE